MSRIRRLKKAEDDLVGLWTYIAHDDAGAADRLMDRIQAKLDLVAEHPLIGRARPEIADSMRSVGLGNYVLFYRPDPEGIVLVRVLSRYIDLDEAVFDL